MTGETLAVADAGPSVDAGLTAAGDGADVEPGDRTVDQTNPGAVAPPPARPALFNSFLSAEAAGKSTRNARRLTYGLSIGAHVGILLFMAVRPPTPVERPTAAPVVPVSFVLPPLAAAAPAKKVEAAKPRPVKPTPVRKPAPVIAQPVAPEPAPAPPPEAAAGVDDGVEGGKTEGTKGGVVGGVKDAPPSPIPGISEGARQALLDRYLSEIFRSRIAAKFRYPPDAERMGIEGTVLVRVSIDKSGRLLGVGLAGGCPHELLCEAAQRTIRDAAPFPVPPGELGASIQVDVPLVYQLE
jgi:protein TonB